MTSPTCTQALFDGCPGISCERGCSARTIVETKMEGDRAFLAGIYFLIILCSFIGVFAGHDALHRVERAYQAERV